MRSTHFAEYRPKADNIQLLEERVEKVSSRGFLAAAIVLCMIYAATPRPILYEDIVKWLSQVIR